MGCPANSSIRGGVSPLGRGTESLPHRDGKALPRAAGRYSTDINRYASDTLSDGGQTTVKDILHRSFTPEQLLRLIIGSVAVCSTFIDVFLAVLQGGDNVASGAAFSVASHYALYLSAYLVGRWLVK